jgi:predicted secreted Zn-dependent protease
MRFLCTIVWLLVGSVGAFAQTPVSQSERLDIHHYEVTGLSPEHLIESFRNRPDPTVMATTRGGVDIRYDFAFGNDECRLMQIDLTLDIDITYPRWREAMQAPASMQAEWQRFITALEIHEQGHVDRFRRAVAALSDQLATIRPAASCHTVRAAVEAERERFHQEISSIQADYERQTDYGATQGARLRFG